MRLMSVLAVLAICIAAVVFFFGIGERPQEPPVAPAKIGMEAPDFTLKDLQGNTVTLSEYRGKVVFLNFWASWCPPCREEMPSMERLHEVYAGRDFVMLAVNVEQDVHDVRAFLEKHPHKFQIPLDAAGRAQGLYGVYRFPETFLIDKNGRIAEHYLGARDWSSVEFLSKINTMLKE
jgi:peroxiredoxin